MGKADYLKSIIGALIGAALIFIFAAGVML
jgi:hypothetical protein